jgi:cytochrome P450
VRRCVGAAFATLEMKEVLRAVAERMRLHAPRPRGERMRRGSVTITPAQGAVVVPEALQPVQSRCPSSAATTA